MMSRKEPFFFHKSHPVHWLQWSRDDDVAESYTDGKVLVKVSELQWSRDDDVAESLATDPNTQRLAEQLQWSRDDDVAESVRCYSSFSPLLIASMEPRR